ncbi:MAG: hypothetical protein IKG82_04270 [Oscillospiraceae bacterium]|nr:hypothetical protein [Oscillospiraceae bacterium]
MIVAGLMNIFFPMVAHADIFNNDVQDVYATITENVDETNEILKSAFNFTQVSPYTVVNSVGGSAGTIGVAIRTATQNLALIVAVLLLMVEFFRKTTNFEWSSKWENILIFLVKLIVIKQVVQNADLIVEYIYKGFNTINRAATSSNMDFLPAGHKVTYEVTIGESLLKDVVQADHWYQGWIKFWEHVGAGETRHGYTYIISQDAVKMFYPNAVFPSGTSVQFEDHAFGNPTTALTFNPTIEIILWQPYFLAMKAIAYMIFVVTIGRLFELSVYTIFAPLPIATFASDTTHDVAKSFIKNYIATVIQIAVIVVMFIVYLAVSKYFANHTSGLSSLKLIQFIALISLGLGVMKSGNWAKKICGAA